MCVFYVYIFSEEFVNVGDDELGNAIRAGLEGFGLAGLGGHSTDAHQMRYRLG